MEKYDNMDFIGFSFRGVHSSTLNIVRTSNGNRYTTPINSTLKEETVSPGGMDGMYLFGVYVTDKSFTISFAFDNLTDDDV